VQYTLPELGYPYSALEPQLSARIVELHHSRHHAGHVKSANETLEKLAEARRSAVDESFGSASGLQAVRDHQADAVPGGVSRSEAR
jgi:superoxide dismutase, Fe-Mn family